MTKLRRFAVFNTTTNKHVGDYNAFSPAGAINVASQDAGYRDYADYVSCNEAAGCNNDEYEAKEKSVLYEVSVLKSIGVIMGEVCAEFGIDYVPTGGTYELGFYTAFQRVKAITLTRVKLNQLLDAAKMKDT